MLDITYKEIKNKKFQEFIKQYKYNPDFHYTISKYSSDSFLNELQKNILSFGSNNPVLRKIYLYCEFPLNFIKYNEKHLKQLLFDKINELDFDSNEYKEKISSLDLNEKELSKLKKKYRDRFFLNDKSFYNNEIIRKLISSSSENLSLEVYLKTLNFHKIKKDDLKNLKNIYCDFILKMDKNDQIKVINFLKKYTKRIKFILPREMNSLSKDVQDKLKDTFSDKSEWYYESLMYSSSYHNLNKLDFYYNLFNSGEMIYNLNNSFLIHKYVDFIKNTRKNNHFRTSEKHKLFFYKQLGDLYINKKISYIGFLNALLRFDKYIGYFRYYIKETKYNKMSISANEYMGLGDFLKKYSTKKDLLKILKILMKKSEVFNKEEEVILLKEYDYNDLNQFISFTELRKETLNYLLTNKNISYITALNLFPTKLNKQNKIDFIKEKIFLKEEDLLFNNIKSHPTSLYYLINILSHAKEEGLNDNDFTLFYEKMKQKFLLKNNFFKEMDILGISIYPESYNLKRFESQNYPINKYLNNIKGSKNKSIFIKQVKNSNRVNSINLLNILKVASLFKKSDNQRVFLERTQQILENNNGMEDINLKKISPIFSSLDENKIKKFILNDDNFYFSTFIHRMEQFSSKINTINIFFINNPEKKELLYSKYKKTLKGFSMEKIHTELYKFYDDLFHHQTKFIYDIKCDVCFVDEQTEFFLPKNSTDLRSFGRIMNNCIKGYIEEILKNESYIICIKKNGKPFINCELKKINNKLYLSEMKRKNNKVLSKEESSYIKEKLRFLNLID